jgi:hypothetical protein
MVLTLLLPASAFAQTPAASPAAAQQGGSIVETKSESGYQVWFPVDSLGAGGMDPNGAIVKGSSHASRMMLMRPRLQFVPEMLKSVEAL